MSHQTSQASTCSAEFIRPPGQLFQLRAIGFSHPGSEFRQRLQNGDYTRALGESTRGLPVALPELPAPLAAEKDYEAQYIHLFHTGRSGKPMVSLNAGDHDTVLAEQGRPEFLLQYADWYRHFGLRVSETESNELPDHLLCQLELMAWLAYLEHSSNDEPGLQRGYRLAQRDFLQRHLLPLLESLAQGLRDVRSGEPIAAFYQALADLALECSAMLLGQLNTLASESAESGDKAADIAAVNLWG